MGFRSVFCVVALPAVSLGLYPAVLHSSSLRVARDRVCLSIVPVSQEALNEQLLNRVPKSCLMGGWDCPSRVAEAGSLLEHVLKIWTHEVPVLGVSGFPWHWS